MGVTDKSRRSAMPKIGTSVRCALAAICLPALTYTADAGTFTRGCAVRDIQVLSLVEERESAGAISSQRSTDAILTIMHARMVCFEGRVLDALAIYNSVSDSIMPTAALSGRKP
jgi:hypothetical protein